MQISLSSPQPSLQPPPLGQATTCDRPALWNPRAATCWGLLLSPAFSAYLHMRNWEALGDADKAHETRTWFYLLCAYLALCCLLAVVSELLDRDVAPPLISVLGLLAAWHVRAGRGQERYVAVLTNNAYTRRPWAGILLAGLGIGTGIAVLNAALVLSVGP